MSSHENIVRALAGGPKSSRELGMHAADLWKLEARGVIVLDPDMWPEYVVGDPPLIARLPGDQRLWPGWGPWNV